MWRKLVVGGLLSTCLTGMAGLGQATVMAPAATLPAVRQGASQVPVLLYHHLDPGSRGENGAVISAAEFEGQMAWLGEHGYTAITTGELRAWLLGVAELPPKPVLITFDDGYQSNYQHAYPILQQHGMKATIFVVTAKAGGREGDLQHLSWAEMREMVSAGVVEVQAHTHDGHRQEGGRPALITWDGAAIRSDLRTLQHSLSAAQLPVASAYAYPFGAYDTETVASLREEGITTAFTVEKGFVRQGDDPMRLKRLIVFPGATACTFGELVSGRPAGTCGD